MRVSLLRFVITGSLFWTLSSCSFNRLFYPSYYQKEAVLEQSDNKYRSFFLTSKNLKKLHCVQFECEERPAKAQIVYFHGNAGSIASYQSVATTFCKAGYDCLLVDYIGYGQSEGTATHRSFLESGRTVAAYVQQQKYDLPVLLYGFSIGGHLSLTIAKEFQHQFDALITEGAFTAHKAIAVASVSKALKFWAKLLIKSRYSGIKAIEKIHIPKLIIHSKEDSTVPYWMGEALRDKATQNCFFWPIKGRHGSAMQDSSSFFGQLNNLIENIDDL